ncbi:hypothetical protein Tco_1419804 [Tanacetum coccineum]
MERSSTNAVDGRTHRRSIATAVYPTWESFMGDAPLGIDDITSGIDGGEMNEFEGKRGWSLNGIGMEAGMFKWEGGYDLVGGGDKLK